MKSGNDWLTIAAIGLLAMCLVTFDHEGLGHGSACLLLHGHITLLSSSIFHCDVRSDWIDPAGPLGNLLMGTLALVVLRFVPARLPELRLFLIAVTALSFFWEGAYVIYAMYRRNGDLYFFAQFLWGDFVLWQRLVAAACGFVLYVFTVRLTSRALLGLWPDAAVARRAAQTVWIGATLGAAIAALAFRGQGWGDFRDAVLEIGVASFPLLFIPRRGETVGSHETPVTIARRYVVVASALVVLAIFAATLGRGLMS
ncbi:MAG: hypothetical protein ABSC92_12480 [Rhizomicrobium sp.]